MVYIHIFVLCPTEVNLIFEVNLISKEIRRAEHEYMNIHPPPPQITPLYECHKGRLQIGRNESSTKEQS